jgi:hypothetical protein
VAPPPTGDWLLPVQTPAGPAATMGAQRGPPSAAAARLADAHAGQARPPASGAGSAGTFFPHLGPPPSCAAGPAHQHPFPAGPPFVTGQDVMTQQVTVAPPGRSPARWLAGEPAALPLPALPSSAAASRRHVRRLLHGWQLAGCLGTALLLASELARRPGAQPAGRGRPWPAHRGRAEQPLGPLRSGPRRQGRVVRDRRATRGCPGDLGRRAPGPGWGPAQALTARLLIASRFVLPACLTRAAESPPLAGSDTP